MVQKDIVSEADRLLTAIQASGLTMRLLGGLAIRYHCPSATHRGLVRSYPDIDFVAHKEDARRIREFLEGQGYEPNRRFNGLYGDKRLLFYDNPNNRQIDVFLDVFEMCHKLNLRKRLELEPITIPLADLLFTKLQIVEINEKDIKDIMALLRDHALGDKDGGETINAAYLAKLASEDWGIYKTFTQNISKLKYFLERYDLEPAAKEDIRGKLNTLAGLLEATPKTLGWRVRARVGERVRWYEPVEDAVREAIKPKAPDAGGKE